MIELIQLGTAIRKVARACDRMMRASSRAYAAGYRIESRHGRNVLVKRERTS